MESSVSKKQLAQQVESFHQKRLIKLGALLLIAASIITIALATLHISRSREKSHLEDTHTALSLTHKQRAKSWHTRSAAAKKLTALKNHTAGSSPAPLLRKIAQIIPPRTLLTTFSLTKKTLTLTGYAATTEELSEFMIELSRSGLTKIALSTSRNEPSGIYFMINSCSENIS